MPTLKHICAQLGWPKIDRWSTLIDTIRALEQQQWPDHYELHVEWITAAPDPDCPLAHRCPTWCRDTIRRSGCGEWQFHAHGRIVSGEPLRDTRDDPGRWTCADIHLVDDGDRYLLCWSPRSLRPGQDVYVNGVLVGGAVLRHSEPLSIEVPVHPTDAWVIALAQQYAGANP